MVSPLQSLDDYQDWRKLIDHCGSLEGLTDYEKERAKRALLFLRHELGEDFLKNGFQTAHPLMQRLMNLAPWTRKSLAGLAEELGALKKDPKYGQLLTRLKDKDRYVEADQVLHVAGTLTAAGFTTQIDPEVAIGEGLKVPDLRIVDVATDDTLYVEVSGSTPSVIERNAFETLDAVNRPIWRTIPFLQHAVRIHKALSTKHLYAIVGQVEKLVERAKEENAFQSLVVNGVIDMGVAPESDREMLARWAADRGIEIGTISGPPVIIDELQRTKAKIRREQLQLPKEGPNLIVLFGNNFFFHVRDVGQAVNDLEEAVYEHGHLLAVVVAGIHLGQDLDLVVMHNQHMYARRVRFDFMVEEHLVLLNRFCDWRVSASTITKLYSAFRPH